MKKVLFILMFCILLISSVSAWSYDRTEVFEDATAFAEIVGTLPTCEGTQNGNLCAGFIESSLFLLYNANGTINITLQNVIVNPHKIIER